MTLKDFAKELDKDERTIARWKHKGLIDDYSEESLEYLKNNYELLFTKNGTIKKDVLIKQYNDFENIVNYATWCILYDYVIWTDELKDENNTINWKDEIYPINDYENKIFSDTFNAIYELVYKKRYFIREKIEEKQWILLNKYNIIIHKNDTIKDTIDLIKEIVIGKANFLKNFFNLCYNFFEENGLSFDIQKYSFFVITKADNPDLYDSYILTDMRWGCHLYYFLKKHDYKLFFAPSLNKEFEWSWNKWYKLNVGYNKSKRPIPLEPIRII